MPSHKFDQLVGRFTSQPTFGIRPVRLKHQLAHLAEGLDIRCEPHTHGSIISQHANLHGICAIPSCQYFEIPVPLGLLDVLTTAVIRPDAAGYVSPPQGPGLGVELDMDQVSELTTELRP